MFVGFYDDLTERPRELLTDVFRHLGVSTDVDWTSFPYRTVIHRGAGASMPKELRRDLTEMYRDDLRRLRERFGDRIARWQRETN
jgi:hypothetical protein